MILIIDNYDSFVYNLYQLLGELNPDIVVRRNDAISLTEITKMNPELIVLSPGPGRPADAGICEELVQNFYKDIPILGICLGHQAIIESFHGTVSYAKSIMHGKASEITVDPREPLFKHIKKPIVVGRYHSLAGTKENWPAELKIIAYSDDDEIMAVRHKKYPVYGLQFHPESILTKDGRQMMINLLKEIKKDD